METGLGVGLGILIGVPLTLLGSYWLFVLQRGRRELGYNLLSNNVLIPGPPEATPDIRLIVRNELIDPDSPAKDKFSDVDEVRGYRILLRNSGTEPIENQSVEFRLGESAVIIGASIESQPDLGQNALDIAQQAGNSYTSRLQFPFLNPRQEIIISLQSIRDAEAECKVSAPAPGLVLTDIAARTSRIRNFSVAILGSLSIGIFAGNLAILLLYGTDDNSRPTWLVPTTWALSTAGLVVMGCLAAVVLPHLARTLRSRRQS